MIHAQNLTRLARGLLLLLGCALLAGCGSIFEQKQSCALIIRISGVRKATPSQVAAIEKRIAPELAARGMKITHDGVYAEMIAQVEFIPDVANPDDGEVILSWVTPNPMARAAISISPSSSDPLPRQSSVQQISEYEMKSLGRDGPTPR